MLPSAGQLVKYLSRAVGNRISTSYCNILCSPLINFPLCFFTGIKIQSDGVIRCLMCGVPPIHHLWEKPFIITGLKMWLCFVYLKGWTLCDDKRGEMLVYYCGHREDKELKEQSLTCVQSPALPSFCCHVSAALPVFHSWSSFPPFMKVRKSSSGITVVVVVVVKASLTWIWILKETAKRQALMSLAFNVFILIIFQLHPNVRYVFCSSWSWSA